MTQFTTAKYSNLYMKTLSVNVSTEFRKGNACDVVLKLENGELRLYVTDGFDTFHDVWFRSTPIGLVQAKDDFRRLVNYYLKNAKIVSKSTRQLLSDLKAKDKHGLLTK